MKEVHQLLKQLPLNFIGNVEGRDIYSGKVDVIVADGFVGNVALKTLEGGLEVILGVIRAGLASTADTRAAGEVLAPVLEPLFDFMGPETTGGAILLGVDGVCIISHGRSSARAVTKRDRARARWSWATSWAGCGARSRRRGESFWAPCQARNCLKDIGEAQRDTSHPSRNSEIRYSEATRPSPDAKTEDGESVPAETHVERAPLDRQAVFELIRDRLADILEVEPGTITESASFADDLEADSLALIELVEALEEELSERSVGFRIEDEDLEDLKTVRDAVDYVYGRVGEGSG